MACVYFISVGVGWEYFVWQVWCHTRCLLRQLVACKKEDGEETIVDQRDVDIGKVADAVAQTEYVCEELSTKIRSV